MSWLEEAKIKEKEALREILGAGGEIDLAARQDGLQSVQHEHRLGRSLNDFFNARITNDATGVTSRADLDELWTSAGLVCPAGYRSLAVYSRKAFSYPILSMNMILPTLAAGASNWMGFEDGGSAPAFIAALRVAGTSLRFLIGADGSAIYIYPPTDLIPVDYDTVAHRYGIKINRCNVEVSIDDVVIVIVLLGLRNVISTGNFPPYRLGSVNSPFPPAAITTLFEVATSGTGSDILLGSEYNYFSCVDGDPMPLRQYPLYTENTAIKWAGLATAGALQTSHPVPVWGYTRKSLLFQATGAGTLTVQIYAGGGWRTIATPTVVADTLVVYDLAAETPIARCTYDPSNNDTITLAEWGLS